MKFATHRKRRAYETWRSSGYAKGLLAKEFKKLKGICPDCGGKMRLIYGAGDFDDRATFDHNKPLSLGGYTKRRNLRVCCRKCNRLKGNKYEQ